jgi:Superinfection immunity protein
MVMVRDGLGLFSRTCWARCLGLAAYLAPTFIATRRGIPNDASVAVVNLFLGRTLIGWVVGLAMAVAGTRPSRQGVPDASGPPVRAKVATNATKKCPDCAETVLADARACKHCRYRFAPSAPHARQELAPLKSAKVRCHHCQHVQMAPLGLSTFVCEQCNTKLKRRTG